MNTGKKTKFVLMAEDDDDHFMLAKEAFQEAYPQKKLHRVANGQELMDALLGFSLPQLILMDLNMPKKDGRQCLKEIKAHPNLNKIPIAILTTSTNKDDEIFAHSLGITAFIRKPVQFKEYVRALKELEK